MTILARTIPRLTPKETLKFLSKINFSRGCWEWTGEIKNHYGKFSFTGASWLAHRVSYEVFTKEQIPRDMVIDHLCKNRRCVNPAHLEVVTASVNGSRNSHAEKELCKNGHVLAGSNLVNTSRKSRRCRTCNIIQCREYKIRAGEKHKRRTHELYLKRKPKHIARVRLNEAVRRGKLVRPSVCGNCGVECKPEGHHTDYSKPLMVQWLCKKCHEALHVTLASQ